MPYNFAADSFHTKKLYSRLSSSEVHFLIEIGRFAFLRPPLGNLGATYDDHLRLIGKSVVDFLLALIELFSLGVTAEALRAIIAALGMAIQRPVYVTVWCILTLLLDSHTSVAGQPASVCIIQAGN